MSQVTVLMAVYNGMPYLPAAMDSILNQTFSDFEFLIVNDCSTDETRNIILSYDDSRIRLLDNSENIRQTKSLNRGLASTRTEFVARMDADDISHPTRLEKQAAYLKSHPEVAVAGTFLRYIDVEGRVTGSQTHPDYDEAIRWMQLFYCPITNGSAMFRKSVIWDRLKGYDETVSVSQDWELWSRVPRECKLANVPDPLLDVRLHPEQYSKSAEGRQEEKQINRDNLRRVLCITEDSEEWLRKVDLLLWEERHACRRHPDHFLEVLEVMYAQFSDLYPGASEDPYILEQLALQYFRAADSSGLRHVPTAIRALQLAWPICSKGLYARRFFRWLAIFAGLRQIKDWLRIGAGTAQTV
jgi:glycosyltransferase involved in cell wall biosynthesis